MAKAIPTYVAACLLLSLTLAVLSLQTVLMALHQLQPGWTPAFDPIVPIAGMFWSTLAALLLLSLWHNRGAAPQPTANRAQRIGLRAAALIVAGKFVLFEIGKLHHNAEMEEFFRISGYPAWLHYAVVVAELTGAVCVLLPNRWVRSCAAAGLLAIMAAAVATHLHNGDPLSDSYDAMLQALYLLALLGLAISSPGRSPRIRQGLRLP